MTYHRVRNVVAVIGDMRVDVTTSMIIMGNHLPTIITAMVREISIPTPLAIVPASVGSFRIITMESLLYSTGCLTLMLLIFRLLAF